MTAKKWAAQKEFWGHQQKIPEHSKVTMPKLNKTKKQWPSTKEEN